MVADVFVITNPYRCQFCGTESFFLYPPNGGVVCTFCEEEQPDIRIIDEENLTDLDDLINNINGEEDG